VACLLEEAMEGMEPLETLLPGQRLAGYQLTEEIGRGASGIVFRAKHFELNREVALKIHRPGPFAGSIETARFRREAEAIARLRHPHIVTVHEVGEVSGWLFIALDYVPGGDLEKFLRQGLPTPRMAAEWIRNLADAIAHAHSRGVYHRDLKPGNLLVDERGQLKLTDFGIARLADHELALTQSGEFFGTAGYMAPEQISRGSSDRPRSADIYGLGAILFHCLVGKPPFHGEALAEVLLKVTRDEARLPEEASERAGRDLETICLKCLEKDPSARYRSAEALRADLDRFLRDEPIAARPVDVIERGFKWCRRNPLPAMLIGAFLTVVTVAVLIVNSERRKAETEATVSRHEASRSRALLTRQFIARGSDVERSGDFVGALPWYVGAWKNEAPPESSTVEHSHQIRLASTLARAPRLKSVWKIEHNVSAVAVSPDGQLAAAAGASGSIVLWNAQTGELLARESNSAASINSLAWSNDGYRLVSGEGVGSQGGQFTVWKIPELTPALRIPVKSWVRYAEMSSDGRWIATATRSGEVCVWNTDDGSRASAPLRHQDRVVSVRFHSDGSRLASASWDGTASIWDWRSGKAVVTVRHPEYVRALALDSSGTRFATASDDQTAQVWDFSTGAPIGSALNHRARVNTVDFSPDGRWLATGSNDGTARVWDAASGRPVSPPLIHGVIVGRVAFSPDGRHLMTASFDGGIQIWDPVSGARVSSPVSCRNALEIAWLADSTGYVVGGEDGLIHQWMLPGGTPDVRRLRLPGQVTSMQLNGDGTQLIATIDSDFAILWNWQRPASTPVSLRHGDIVSAVGYSPDSHLCFTTSQDGTARLWNAETGQAISPPLEHGAPVRCAAFTSDGTELITGDAKGRLRRWDSLTGKALGILATLPGPIHFIAVAPDGHHLAVSAEVTNPSAPDVGQSTVSCWEIPGFRPIGHQHILGSELYDLTFSPDGSQLALADSGGLVTLVSMSTPDAPPMALQHQTRVRSVRFSRDGGCLLTASDNGSVRMWDTRSARLLPGGISVTGAARASFSPDGHWILTAGRNGVAQIWDAAASVPIFPRFKHDDNIRAAAMTPDQAWLVTGGRDRCIKVWSLATERLTLAEAKRRVALVSGQTVDSAGTLIPISASNYFQIWENEHGTAVPNQTTVIPVDISR
jgi:WD40 repeat protein/serine/threonine protein kinase